MASALKRARDMMSKSIATNSMKRRLPPYHSINASTYQDVWDNDLGVLSDITDLDLHNVPDETIERIKEKIMEFCRERMMQMNAKLGFKVFTDDENGFRITDDGRNYIIKNYQVKTMSMKKPSLDQLSVLVDLYHDNPFSFFAKVTGNVPKLANLSDVGLILNTIEQRLKTIYGNITSVTDRRLDMKATTVSKSQQRASVTVAKMILDEPNIPKNIKNVMQKEILRNEMAGVELMRKSINEIRRKGYPILSARLRAIIELEENDAGIFTARYTSTALKSDKRENNYEVNFIEEYSESTGSAENAFSLFLRNIPSYRYEAAETFGYRGEPPKMQCDIMIFDETLYRNGTRAANTFVSKMHFSDIKDLIDEDDSIMSTEALCDMIQENEIDSGGMHEENERRRNAETEYLGTKIYLTVMRPYANRVGSFNKCFLPDNVKKMLRWSVDIPMNKDEECLLDTFCLWARRKEYIRKDVKFEKSRECGMSLKNNREAFQKRFPNVYELLSGDAGEEIFKDGLINEAILVKISDMLGWDISVYRLSYNDEYYDLTRGEPEKVCEVLPCYNTRDKHEHKANGCIPLLILSDESDMWDIMTYQKYQPGDERIGKTHGCFHVALIVDIITLIHKVSGLPKQQYCEDCQRYFGNKETYDRHFKLDPSDKKMKCHYSFKSMSYSKTFNNPKIDAMMPSYIIAALDFEAFLVAAKGTDMKRPGNSSGIAHYHQDMMNRIDATWVDRNVHIITDEEYLKYKAIVPEFVCKLVKLCEDFWNLKPKKDEDRDKFEKDIEELKNSIEWGAVCDNEDERAEAIDRARSLILIKYLDNILCKVNTRINYGITSENLRGEETSAAVAIKRLDHLSKVCKVLFSNNLINIPYDKVAARAYKAEHPDVSDCMGCGKEITAAERVVHHNHITGEIVFVSCCKSCNRKLRPKDLSVLCHNASKYDNHFIIDAIKKNPEIQSLVTRLNAVSKSMGRYMKLTINNFSILDTVFYEPTSLDAIGKSSYASVSKMIIDWEENEHHLPDLLHNLVISATPCQIMDVIDNLKNATEVLKCKENDLRLLRGKTIEALDMYVPKLYKTQIKSFNEREGAPENLWKYLDLTCKKLPQSYEFVETAQDLDEPIMKVLRYSNGEFQLKDKKPELKKEIEDLEDAVEIDYELLAAKKKEYKETCGVLTVFKSALRPELKEDSKKDIDEFVKSLKDVVTLCELGNIKTLREYYEVYLLNDTSMLLDWGLVFGNRIHEVSKIYPFSGICSTAGTAYYAGLLSVIKNGIKLGAYDCNGKANADKIHDMFNKGLFGGIASVSMKKVVAQLGESIIIPMDANALYPSNMQLWIPTGDFRYSIPDGAQTPKEIIDSLYEMSCIKAKCDPKYLESKMDAIVEIDGYFPIKTHRLMREYCMMLEHHNPSTRTFSEYQKRSYDRIYRNGNGNTENLPEFAEDAPKLMATMYDRKEQVFDVGMVHDMMKYGFVVTKVHCITTFRVQRALKPYMDKMNMLRADAPNKQMDGIYKTISNSFYGRCCMKELGTKINFYISGARTLNRSFSQYTKATSTVGKFVEMKEEDPHMTSSTPRFISIYTLMQTKRIMLEAYMMLKKILPSTQLAICDTDSMYVHIQYKKDGVKLIEGDVSGAASVIKYINEACDAKNPDGTFKYHSGHFFNPYDMKSYEEEELNKVDPDEVRNDPSLHTYLIDTSNLKDPLVKTVPCAPERSWNAFKFDKPCWIKGMTCLGPKVYCCECSDYKYEIIVTGPRSSNFEAEFKAVRCKAQIDEKTKTPTYLRAIHSSPSFRELPFNELRSLEGCEIKAKLIGLLEDEHQERRMKGIKKAFSETIKMKDFEKVAYYEEENIDGPTPGRLDIGNIGLFRETSDGRMTTMVVQKVALTDFDNKKWCPKYKKDDPDQFRYNFGDIAIAVIEAIGNQPHDIVDEVTDILLEEFSDEELRKMMSADSTFDDRTELHEFIKSLFN